METDQSAPAVGVQAEDAATRWGRAGIREGATFLPNALLVHQQDLNLSSTELVVLIHVIRAWAAADEPALPALPDIARAMDLGPASVGRCLGVLEELGLLRALGDGRYDLGPLVARLDALSNQELQ